MSSSNKQNSRRKSFNTYFEPTLNLLAQLGVEINLKNEKTSTKAEILQKITFVAVIMCFIYTILKIIWMVQVWSVDKFQVMLLASSVFYNISLITKGLQLVMLNKDLRSMIKELAFMWKENQSTDECDVKISKTAGNVLIFSKIFIGLMKSIIVLWGVQPILNISKQYMAREATNHTYDYSKTIFVVYYPFKITTAVTYFAIVFEELWLTYYYILWWSVSDTLFAQLTSHVGYQFEILKYDIERLINQVTDEISLKRNLVLFANRHRSLLRLCNTIQRLYGTVIFVTISLSSMSLCLGINGLKKLFSVGAYGTAIIYSILLIVLATQIFVYCTFAESLTNQTASIADAIYGSKWMEKNPNLKIFFQMFIMKSQKAFYCSGYGFFQIGHVQLAKIINGAMSYYMFTQATN